MSAEDLIGKDLIKELKLSPGHIFKSMVGLIFYLNPD
jgi:hypothetical protein